MVEKVESFLRGQWSVFNIYVSVSSGVSFSRLVAASRRGLLVVASCRLVSFLSLRLARGGCGGDVIRGAFHVGGILAWASRVLVYLLIVYLVVGVLFLFLRFVSRFVNRLVLIPSRLVLVVIVEGGEEGRCVAGMSLPSCGYGGGVLFPYVDWLGGSIGTCRFIQLGFSYSHLRGRVCAHGVMVSIWDELVSW